MVLDTAKRITRNRQRRGFPVNDYELIFKNTYDDYVDEKNSGDPLKQKQVIMNAKDPSVTDLFYYVHIDVDLDAVPNCTCSESGLMCKCR